MQSGSSTEACDVTDRPSHTSKNLEIPHETVGAMPGTLHIESDEKPRIFLVDYSESNVEERELAEIDDCIPYIDQQSITWIDIRGIGHEPVFRRLAEIFDIHPLALEDLVNVPQRPKSEAYPSQHIFVCRMVSLLDGDLKTEQFGILFGKGYVVTVQEEPLVDCLDPVRQRIRRGRGLIRKAGSDYLAYALLDAVIDGFYPVLEKYGETLDELELHVLKTQHASSNEIFGLKRELLQLRRAIWPQRDLLSQLLRDDSPHINEETRRYYRDTYDHSVQIMDMVETFREIASSLMDLLMTGVSNRLNEVMKVLTIVSTIFLPMTFIAGVYGMNFNPEISKWNMPELNWVHGYPFSLALMVVSATLLLLYYRSRGWIGGRHDRLGRALDRLQGKAGRGRRIQRKARGGEPAAPIGRTAMRRSPPVSSRAERTPPKNPKR
ncbi:MAG: magnesium/cobalt transporter CorA [Polyangiaceae bacterium]|nr:magnesium/cobalt transporter CorA [Polyangiaceae bacterium]